MPPKRKEPHEHNYVHGPRDRQPDDTEDRDDVKFNKGVGSKKNHRVISNGMAVQSLQHKGPAVPRQEVRIKAHMVWRPLGKKLLEKYHNRHYGMMSDSVEEDKRQMRVQGHYDRDKVNAKKIPDNVYNHVHHWIKKFDPGHSIRDPEELNMADYMKKHNIKFGRTKFKKQPDVGQNGATSSTYYPPTAPKRKQTASAKSAGISAPRKKRKRK